MSMSHMSVSAAILLLFSLLATPVTAVEPPSRGCYWTGCESKWFGQCSPGHILDHQSDNCDGLCGESNSPPCLPFHSHFHCCVPEIPKVRHACGNCKSALDFGKQFVCCSDCSVPYIVTKDSKLGYCKTGAELSIQLIPQETFKWVSGPWIECSAPCDGGVHYRDVGCYGSVSNISAAQYLVDDENCHSEEMPAKMEACNQQSCDFNDDVTSGGKSKTGMSGSLVALITFLSLCAAGGITFAGYSYYNYKKRSYTTSGFVYIMLDGHL